MQYFKLINGQDIVGAASEFAMRRYQAKRNRVLCCGVDEAQYIEHNDTLYHDTWMRSVEGIPIAYEDMSVAEITESEYNALVEAFETSDTLPDQGEPELDPPYDEPEDDGTLGFVKAMKIRQMSAECSAAITQGFEITLSDGERCHFSLEITDQIKIQALALKAQRGESPLYWHADGELCKFYPAEDILAIYAEMEKIQTWHTTYFNSLRAYIESLDSAADVGLVTYGMEIPAEYQSEVLQYLAGAYAS